MTRITHVYRSSAGVLFTDEYTIYPCYHVHYKYGVDNRKPTRAKRITKRHPARKRLEELLKHGS